MVNRGRPLLLSICVLTDASESMDAVAAMLPTHTCPRSASSCWWMLCGLEDVGE